MQFPLYSTQYEPKMIYIPTHPMEGCWKSVGISKGRYEPKWEFPEGVQTKRIRYGVGEGKYGYFADQFVSCSAFCFAFCSVFCSADLFVYVREMEIAAP